jgi:hypothetical protein
MKRIGREGKGGRERKEGGGLDAVGWRVLEGGDERVVRE